jgi:NAD(P)-dependent dehydrogenase (short-subunit alcohol dehydrogenase family)
MSRWGRIDILVNNAGVSPTTSLFEIDDSEWDDVLLVNLRSVFVACQLVAPIMRDQRYGRIINHASIAGHTGGTATGPHYAASKAGMIALTKVVARELAAEGITVNAIAPAAIAGAAMDKIAGDVTGLTSTIPVGRVGKPEEVGALVAFLASGEAGFITGATIDFNGGLLMR